MQENEIDLREIFREIKKRKKFIIIFTLGITLLSIIYVFVKKPVYESKALVEIGSYKLYLKDKTDVSKVIIDNPNQLSRKLNVLFIDMKKNDKNRDSEITSITVPNNQNTFFEITSNGVNNELARNEIKNVVDSVRKEHKVVLDSLKEGIKVQISKIDREINNITKYGIKVLDEKIVLQEKSIESYKKQLISIRKDSVNFHKLDPSISVLKLVEQRNISNFIENSNRMLVDLKNERDKLSTDKLSALEDEKRVLESLLLPINYKNSQIVGEIIINDKPIKPKKTLIVIVSFIVGLIFALFLILFLSFIQKLNNK
ncbi:MAG: hypothetical protein C0625_12340 [Arcobacter sp.]|nr:MAG: hypothetical protein C0625_12340 [Arcobacter sp.]